MKNETYVAFDKDGDVIKMYYCKRDEIANYMTVNEYKQLSHVGVMNREADNVNHKVIKKESL